MGVEEERPPGVGRRPWGRDGHTSRFTPGLRKVPGDKGAGQAGRGRRQAEESGRTGRSLVGGAVGMVGCGGCRVWMWI